METKFTFDFKPHGVFYTEEAMLMHRVELMKELRDYIYYTLAAMNHSSKLIQRYDINDSSFDIIVDNGVVISISFTTDLFCYFNITYPDKEHDEGSWCQDKMFFNFDSYIPKIGGVKHE